MGCERLKDTEVRDKPPLDLSTIHGLNYYKVKEMEYIHRNRITPQSFNLLFQLYANWVVKGCGMTMYALNEGYISHSIYQRTYGKLTSLSKRGLVDCAKRSDRVNIYSPSSKAIEGINLLLVGEC